ncbi:prepilin-type N-terminal cleavage/methylation domain-containing protein [Paludibacterium sp.]|nr:prepilin-type N-terminal cleavage/methylation domain-containing protein [Paludibacterium sp.]
MPRIARRLRPTQRGTDSRRVHSPKAVHHPLNQTGMTLIELLVAMSLMAILSVLGYKAFSALLISRERLMAVSTQWVDLARVFARMSGEVGVLFPAPGAAAPLRLEGEAGQQALQLALPSSLLASGVDNIVYQAGPAGLEWSTARAAGQRFALLDAGYHVRWRLQLDDGRWVDGWQPGGTGRPRLLEMQVNSPVTGTITRYWRLP